MLQIRLFWNSLRVIGGMSFVIVCLTTARTSEAKDLYPFPANLAVPGGLPTGAVVARGYFTPMELCGETTCRLTTFRPITINSNVVDGPELYSGLVGLNVQVIVNGKAQRKMDGGAGIEFSERIEVQLFRDGNAEIKDSETPSKIYYWFFAKKPSGGSEISNYIMMSKTTLTKVEGTCSIPNQTVDMPSAMVQKFAGIGSTSGAHSFRIRVDKCPKGYNRIGYTLDPVGGAIAGSPGVLPLATGSTASGVKIRIADDKGEAAGFGTSIKLNDYSKTTGGSYTIPMQASYIQTDATVKPGTVKGKMTVLLDYQ